MIPAIRQCFDVGFPPVIPFMGMFDLDTLKERLRAVRATQQDLADFMGISLKAVNRLANPNGPDGRKTVTAKEMEQINRFFEIRQKPVYANDDEDLRFRRGGVAQPPTNATIPLFTGIDTPDGYVLSVGNSAQHGRVLAHPLQATESMAYAVTIIDDTMSPRFESGEIAYVTPGRPPRKGQDCLVENLDLTARVLQFVERREKQVVFRQLNPRHEVIRRAHEVKVHAIVGRG